MAVTIITVTARYANPDGTAASGTVKFKLSKPFANASTIYHGQTLAATLNGSGQISQSLAANDDAGTAPANTTYTVTEALVDTPEREYQISVPHAAPGGTIDLSALMPNTPPGVG
jgi:hypothetical protein